MIDRKIKEEVTWKVDEKTTRTFIIKRMPAMPALSNLKTLLTRALPLDLFSALDESGFMTKALGAVSNKKEMSDIEFELFMKKLLSYTSEKLPSGEVKIIDDAGNFGVIDMEYNLALVSYLLMQTVLVNYKDFFIEMFHRLEEATGQSIELPEIIANQLNI